MNDGVQGIGVELSTVQTYKAKRGEYPERLGVLIVLSHSERHKHHLIILEVVPACSGR